MQVKFECLKSFPIAGSQQIAKRGDTVEMTMGSALYHRMRQKEALKPLTDQDVTDEAEWLAEFGDETVKPAGTMQPPTAPPVITVPDVVIPTEAEVESILENGSEDSTEDAPDAGGTSEPKAESGSAEGLSREDLMTMTVPDLRQYAGNKGMTGLPDRKADIVDYILEFAE